MKIKHPKLVYLQDKTEVFLYHLKENDKWLYSYFIGGTIFSVFLFGWEIFFPSIKIPYIISVIFGLWWGIPMVPVAIAVFFGIFIAVPIVILKTIAEACFTKIIEIKCLYCAGTGKIEIPNFDTNITHKISCDRCIGTGMQYLRVWKDDVNKIVTK